MRTSQRCPKCQSQAIVHVPGKKDYFGISTGITAFSTIPVSRYVCSECGYCEEWVDADRLRKLVDKFGGKLPEADVIDGDR